MHSASTLVAGFAAVGAQQVGTMPDRAAVEAALTAGAHDMYCFKQVILPRPLLPRFKLCKLSLGQSMERLQGQMQLMVQASIGEAGESTCLFVCEAFTESLMLLVFLFPDLLKQLLEMFA